MEVLIGPAYDMEVSVASSSSSSTPSCVRDQTVGVPPSTTPVKVQDKVLSSSFLLLNENKEEEEEEEGGDHKIRDEILPANGSDDCLESSSSIGVPSDSEEESDDVSSYEEENLHRSRFSMDLLLDNLAIKRGLSNHYNGKSKSFGNLSEVTAMKNIEKEENPFNKRRRLLVATKLLSRNTFYCQGNPKSMPLLRILDDEDENQHNPEKK